MKNMKPENVYICSITDGVANHFTLDNCPPEMRDQITEAMKQGPRSISELLDDFLKKHTPKDNP